MRKDTALEAMLALRDTVDPSEHPELDAELANSLGFARHAGSVALEDQTPAPQPDFAEKLNRFLDPAPILSVHEQLDVMSGFWSRLGFETPDLNIEAGYLDKVLDKHIGWRVVPVPKIGLNGLLAAFDKFKASTDPRGLDPDHMSLLIPEEDTVLGALLREPGRKLDLVGKEDTKFGMYLKNAVEFELSKLVGIEKYYNQLHQYSGLPEDSQGRNRWSLPVVNVASASPANKGKIRDAYKEVSPMLTMGTLAIIEMLHLQNGTASPEARIELANGALYSMSERGAPRELVTVFGIATDGLGVIEFVQLDLEASDENCLVRGADRLRKPLD